MRIAVVGSGIAGVASAYYLNKLGLDVSLFEAGPYFGGHTNTVDIEVDGSMLSVDTGFLVHNDVTYPNLIKFFEELNITSCLSEMSFSVENVHDDILWAGTNLSSVFSQRKNIFSLRFHKFLQEIIRFNHNSDSYILEAKGDLSLTLGDLLKKYNYTNDFSGWYLLPMGGCIWSTPTSEMLDFPAYTFLVFCKNHGLLQIFNRPQWKSISGGCRQYVREALASIEKKYLCSPVADVAFDKEKIILTIGGKGEAFDHCIFATHAPDTLKICGDDSELKSILGKVKYQKNIAVLHRDVNVLPKKKVAWSAWNYHFNNTNENDANISVSYLLNKLQPLSTKESIVVTLNPISEIDEEKVFRKITYEHPVFNEDAVKAQMEVTAIQGKRNLYFCGAWMRYGFHEDGILSAKWAVNKLLENIGMKDSKWEVL